MPRVPVLCALTCLISLGHAARACDTALLLSVDVSNSVDGGEYRVQIDGMADALSDPEIIDAIVEGGAALAVMQWSGRDKQALVLPWTLIETREQALDFAVRARALPRAFVLSDTAPAEAIYFGLDQFASAPACKRHVIDVSGDGTPNSGSDTRLARNAAEQAGVTINGVAIESMGQAITTFYQRAIITRNGFVMTARTHRDYPRAIRAKILRELAKIVG